MDLYTVIKHLYPDLEDDKDFILKNDNDGRGSYILKWNSDLPQPTEDELNTVWVDVQLNTAREMKMKELNKMCNTVILGRFPAEVNGVTYYFSNDMEAQANFEKCDRAFEKARLTEITWTCYDTDGNVQRIVLTPETFEGVYIAHLNHINSNIAKFRDELQPLVIGAGTPEDVENISWETQTGTQEQPTTTEETPIDSQPTTDTTTDTTTTETQAVDGTQTA